MRYAQLLTSTAILALTVTGRPAAQEVRPLGSLDLTLGGKAQFFAAFGDVKEFFGDQNGSYDFATDTEIYVRLLATDEATGLRYGGRIELEADTNATVNADEVYVFLQGRFGEFRFGDDDGATKDLAIVGSNVAVATGGLDGDIIDIDELVFIVDSDSTKVVYYTPKVAGFQAGASFTPKDNSEGQDIGVTDDGGLDDLAEAAFNYEAELGPVTMLVGAGGAYGHFNQNEPGVSEDAWGVNGGLAFAFQDVSTAVGIVHRDFAEAEATLFNVGVAYQFGPAGVSLNWGQVFAADAPSGEPERKPFEILLGAEYRLAPGLRLAFEGAYFDVSRVDDDGVRDSNDNGWIGVGEVLLSF